MPEEIQKLRAEIDRTDDELAAALDKRAGLAQKIGTLKAGGGAYRPERETEILRRISAKQGVLTVRYLPVDAD